MCPHKRAFVLSQGIVGDEENGVTKVSCPMHKKNYALDTGECVSGDKDLKLMTFEIKAEDDFVWLNLPPTHELDKVLGTSKWIVSKKLSKRGKVNKNSNGDINNGIEMLGSTAAVACGETACGDKKLDW